MRELAVTLHSIEGNVPSSPSSARPPSPMGYQGSQWREWPETDLANDATRTSQLQCFEHGLYVQLLTSQAPPQNSVNSEDAEYDLYSAADVSILPWRKDPVPTDIAMMVKKVPTRTGPRCAPSACHPC